MKIEQVLEKLDILENKEALTLCWDKSVESYVLPEILNDKNKLVDIAEFCGLIDDEIKQCLECANLISASKEMSFLFHHIFNLIFNTPEYTNDNFKNLPIFNQLKDISGVFYLLIVLNISYDIRQYHIENNIPEQISRDTLFDVKININRYSRPNNGKLGVMLGVMGWFKTHNTRTLYRIGRLQFHYKKFGDDIIVCRNKSDNKIVTFPKAGVNYTNEGFWAVDDKEDSLESNWISVYEENDTEITGHPITADGKAQKETISIAKEDWEIELKESNGVLDIHIPEGGGMTVDSCVDSMKNAQIFFEKYFPTNKAVGFVCRSWIFSPQYDELYRPDANFVLFQKEVHLFPVWSSGKEGLFFVFDTEDLEDVDVKSSLQKAMVSHIKEGGVLRAGGMFYLSKDIEYLGQRYYLDKV